VCEVLPLTFFVLFCSALKMSHKSDSTPKEETDNSFFVLRAMQQQFERLNLVLEEVKDRMDHCKVDEIGGDMHLALKMRLRTKEMMMMMMRKT